MTSMSDSTRALGADDIERFTKQFGANPAYRLAQTAVTSTSLDDVALDRSIVNTMATPMFGHGADHETEGRVFHCLFQLLAE